MPVLGLSERRRLPRDLKVGLGQKQTSKNGGKYPAEVDYFVIERSIDGKPDQTADPEFVKEVVRLYGAKPKELRMALLTEMEAVDPQTGDELVWNLWNRAYGSNAGLKCRGNGGDVNLPGAAETTDKGWAETIGKAANERPDLLPNGRYRVRCMGIDCPFYASTGEDGKPIPGHERGVCKKVAILRALLLYPDRDPQSPNYCRVLGSVEIATSSVNAMVDIPSGLSLMRSYAGRSAAIPFTLYRQPTWTYKTGKKLHFVCKVKFDLQEVQRIGLIPANQSFLPLEMRETQLRLRSAEVNFDSVRDLYPKALPSHEPEAPPRAVHIVSEGADSAEAVEEALDAAGAEDASLNAITTEAQRDELRELCGHRTDPNDPRSWTPDTMDRLREAVRQYDRIHGTSTPKLAAITVGQAIWLKSLLAAQQAEAEAIDEQFDAEPEVDPDEAPIESLELAGADVIQGELIGG